MKTQFLPQIVISLMFCELFLILYTSSIEGAPLGRLSTVDWDQYHERNVNGPDTYAFGYDVQDPHTDSVHFRQEERLPNGTVVGTYGYVTPDGNGHVVRYVADHRGYRATIETTKRLMADVKPIPVDVDQALADEIASAELSLQQQQQQNRKHSYNNNRLSLE